MEENKKFLENNFVKEFLAAYDECHTAKESEKIRTKKVGDIGESIGATYTLTGAIEYVSDTINGTKQVYLALPTVEGKKLSLMALMGVSSLDGYEFDKEIEVEFDNENGEKQTKKVKATAKATDKEKAWKPATRTLLELAAKIDEGVIDLKNQKATYLGTAVRPYFAKKTDTMFGESFKKDYKRAMVVRMWSVQ